jgi:hypothetical protein
MYILAASFLSYLTLEIYSQVWGPFGFGMISDYSDGAMLVKKLIPGEAGEHAGLRVGDRIVTVNGIPIRGKLHFIDFVSATFEPFSMPLPTSRIPLPRQS